MFPKSANQASGSPSWRFLPSWPSSATPSSSPSPVTSSRSLCTSSTMERWERHILKIHQKVGTMAGYMNFTLSRAPNENWVDEGLPDCFYRLWGQRFFYFFFVGTKIFFLWGQRFVSLIFFCGDKDDKKLFSFFCSRGFRDHEGNLTPVHWLQNLFHIINYHQ